MRLLLTIVFPLLFFIAKGQCNGSLELCDRSYKDVSFLTTHNAYNSNAYGFSFANQHLSISDQLDLGVRGFMLDIYDMFGVATAYHGSFFLGSIPLNEILIEIEGFLTLNPDEVITIILESYVSSSMIETEFTNAGLLNRLYAHPNGSQWPTLQQLINDGKNIVLFSDQNDALPSQPWHHYMWTNMVETHYSVDAPNLFTHDFNRGDSLNDLYIFNHFVTDAVLGTGLEAEAPVVNEYNFLLDRIIENYSLKQKFPNFVTLDFVSIGDGMQVVNFLNQTLAVSNVVEKLSVNIYPNPATSALHINLPEQNHSGNWEIQIIDLFGRSQLSKHLGENSNHTIDISSLSKGCYTLTIRNQNEYIYSEKIILK